jgi:tetratricopeptide (TPR) repeat protein
MSRKKRRLEPVAVAARETKDKVRYQDPFQEKVGKTIEEAGKKLEGQGRNILYGLGALVVVGLIAWIIFSWSGRTSAEAQTALGKAIETSQATISDTPQPAGSTEKTYKTQRERAEAAIGEFQAVVDKFGGAAGEKAKYFIAVNRLSLDRQAGMQELDALSKTGGEVASLSKFALAQTRADDGSLDQAAELYKELSASSDPVIAKETIDFELAKIYEKQGKKQEAVDILFTLVKTASEAKDLDGKSVPLTSTAQSAKDKLTELDPEKAKEIPAPALDLGIDNPFGG